MRLVTAASLGVSAVLGVAALIVAKTALPQAAPKSLEGAAAMLPQQRMTPVVVASNPIKFGDRLDAGHLAVVQVPASAAPEGAFTTIDAVLAQDDGGAPVALTPIAQREALLPSKLSGPGARATVAAEIADGMRAYTIKVTDVSGVGGHALPGDRVDVVLMRNLSTTNNNGSGPPNLVSQVVLQNVRVLGVDLNADPTSSKPAAPSTATLEVAVADAQKLSMAASLGELSLALRRNGAAELAPAPLVRTSDFINARARPAAQATWRPAPPHSVSSGTPARVIRIVEGESGGAGV